jgi:DNA-binding NtrC family response regulator
MTGPNAMSGHMTETLQLRQARYLGYVLLQAGCRGATDRFDARFRSLLLQAEESRARRGGEVRETEPEYSELYLTLWQSGPSSRFIPLIVDAMFHEYFELDRRENPIEAHESFCREALGRFVQRYFPDMDLTGAAFRRLTEICQELADEAQDLSHARGHRAPNLAEIRARASRLESKSPAVRETLRLAGRAARSRAPILLVGETGTGKETLARFLHDQSLRAGGPFVAVNLAAIPDHLLESELFGHRRGAFTGAVADKPGQLTLGQGGTLFLDEIGELSPALQVKLLRFLQDHTILPLGATRPAKLDVRVIAATNRDLETAVQEKTFRQDLYYRLNVFTFSLPPLRLRTEDIPALAAHFIHRYNREAHARVSGISARAMDPLTRASWPGNIRQLENVIQHAVILAGHGDIQPEHLPTEILEAGPPTAERRSAPPERIASSALGTALAEALRARPGMGRTERLALSVSLEHMVRFFEETGGKAFPPREFADHISPPQWFHRRDKLSHRVLTRIAAAGVLEHNGRKAQAARYRLAARFLES